MKKNRAMNLSLIFLKVFHVMKENGFINVSIPTDSFVDIAITDLPSYLLEKLTCPYQIYLAGKILKVFRAYVKDAWEIFPMKTPDSCQ